MRTIWLLPLFMLACAGSSDDKTGDDDDDGTSVTGCLAETLALDVGTGVTEFYPLTAGEPIVMTHGPQGGWHIDVGGQVRGTEQLVEVDAVFVETSTGIQIAGDQQPGRQALVDWTEDGCAGDFFGTRIFVDDSTQGLPSDEVFAEVCTMSDIDVDMTVTVTVLEADPPVSISQTVALKLQLDPTDVTFCDGL